MFKTNQGFTLVEVLVASVILFSSIAVVTSLYRGALISSTKATKRVQITNVIPVAAEKIGYMIRKRTIGNVSNLSGSNQFWGVQVDWAANRVEYRSAPAIYNFDTGKEEKQPKKYMLWHVNTTFSLGRYQLEYQFTEVSWNEN